MLVKDLLSFLKEYEYIHLQRSGHDYYTYNRVYKTIDNMPGSIFPSPCKDTIHRDYASFVSDGDVLIDGWYVLINEKRYTIREIFIMMRDKKLESLC